jgi:hypothetical protein
MGAVIPRRFIRTVPETVNDEHERFWHELKRLHPGWNLLTYRDPIEPAAFPETSPLWERCESGAQKANLVRLEALYRLGGVYLDADVEPLANMDHLLGEPFAAWEDDTRVSNAVMGFPARHPALRACLDIHLALFPNPPMPAGVRVTTAVFPGRPDVRLYGPELFFPYHYTEPERRHEDFRSTGALAVHHWAATWVLTP